MGKLCSQSLFWEDAAAGLRFDLPPLRLLLPEWCRENNRASRNAMVGLKWLEWS